MKSTELKNKDKTALTDMLSQKREALRRFRFGSAGSKIRNVKEGTNLKKDIARILTELNAKSKPEIMTRAKAK
ncbi:MAG: 50S ribosomal protein L29 [Patescibacteria group bacterium]